MQDNSRNAPRELSTSNRLFGIEVKCAGDMYSGHVECEHQNVQIELIRVVNAFSFENAYE